MKKIIQLILFFFLIIISLIFYKVYFSKIEKVQINKDLFENQLLKQSENNLIKNLKYEVRLDRDNQYIVNSELSEITYVNDVEIVNMQKVIAIFTDKTNIPITIISDEAVYDSSNYNTNFSKNVRIDYLDNLIFSDKMELDFINNEILIFENVKYDGLQGIIKADNIKIDLITKKIKIYMDNNIDKVVVTTK
jgi:hypothetical protein